MYHSLLKYKQSSILGKFFKTLGKVWVRNTKLLSSLVTYNFEFEVKKN